MTEEANSVDNIPTPLEQREPGIGNFLQEVIQKTSIVKSCYLSNSGNIYIDNRGQRINLKPRVEVGRNDPCPCGSGKKFKKCCG